MDGGPAVEVDERDDSVDYFEGDFLDGEVWTHLLRQVHGLK